MGEVRDTAAATPRSKIAIVGSGVSGLTTAYVLGRNHDVTVFEADDRVGGHANTVDVDVEGTRCTVDTGFIVYNERTYPNFCTLLDRLGVPTQASDMSFSVSSRGEGVEYATHSIDAIFARRASVLSFGFHKMIREILRFNRESRELSNADRDSECSLTLGEYLARNGYSRRFIEHYIVPMGSAIWSAAPSRFLDFPAVTFVRFFENHGLLDHRDNVPWRTVSGGSRSYVKALVSATNAQFHTNCPVLAATRETDGAYLLLPDGVRLRFDHVIFACHSDTALEILGDPTDAERKVLAAIGYQTNEVLLHTDESIMPARRRAWASWNYRVPEQEPGAAVGGRVGVTYWMNRLQDIVSPKPLLVSLNSEDSVDREQVLRSFTYHHPVYDMDTLRAQKRRAEIDGVDRTHFCGAYWGHGFHEDGVASALEVCRRFEAWL